MSDILGGFLLSMIIGARCAVPCVCVLCCFSMLNPQHAQPPACSNLLFKTGTFAILKAIGQYQVIKTEVDAASSGVGGEGEVGGGEGEVGGGGGGGGVLPIRGAVGAPAGELAAWCF